MAVIGTINKQPREIVDFDISYSKLMQGRTDQIVSATVEISPEGELEYLAPVINNPFVKVTLSGGVTNSVYTVTVLASTTAGLRYEDEVYVNVEEIS